ncbi:fumarylacetoacetate hydrolase family protein [Sneathiella aquimaris]|uniref:fumarylacetoacetate hydrolase family protein n=1 Tax=Sneathiella aquimaris TaxID=2599305 RepID=UPI00146B356E|nr:fumarylacetoacetate hydrolase family protein [Sneathiella aquimaris]
MPYLFEPAAVPALPILGQDTLFPVHRIYCVGRNYAEHTKEMGGDPTREAPFFFSKPADAIVQNRSTIDYPAATENLHFEMELVLAIGKKGRNISVDAAPGFILGYACGIDLTRRDLQAAAKQKGRPWDCAKGFDQSAPCSAIRLKSETSNLASSRIWLDVNQSRKQEALISDMIWSPAEVTAHLSCFYELVPGDLIFTGTPAGVGAIKSGDHIVGGIEGLETVELNIR